MQNFNNYDFSLTSAEVPKDSISKGAGDIKKSSVTFEYTNQSGL